MADGNEEERQVVEVTVMPPQTMFLHTLAGAKGKHATDALALLTIEIRVALGGNISAM